jgi:hypothetical protein
MNRRFWRLGALAVLATLCLSGAEVAGKWRADFTTPDGVQRFNIFTFRLENGKLEGTVAGAQDETPIRDGKLQGDEISFVADRPFGTFTYKGKIAGDEIRFKVEFNDNVFEMTAKRQRQ